MDGIGLDGLHLPTRCCRVCHHTKSINQFNTLPKTRQNGGYDNRCKECKQIYSKQHYRQNQAKILLQHKAWRDANPSVWARCRAVVKQYRTKRVRQATPPWAKYTTISKQIREIYRNRPPGHHVDHIIPIKGKLVSGLHVPWNLQYLPSTVNLQKRNRLVNLF